jgi:7,8-dihydropterin-6-yl-methyl-4-(beta-D-ribofuranosyl)aminobenzene 5'-phosphate synthase
VTPTLPFGETENVAITVLVDNSADLMARSTRTVKRFTRAPLLAEHGFAALIHLKAAGVRILWDAGFTPLPLLENAKRMGIKLAQIDKIALSHGHGDHTAAVTDVLRAALPPPQPKKWPARATAEEIRRYAEGRRLPLIAHPAAFRERWDVARGGTRFGPVPPPPRAEWEAAGAKLLLTEGPFELGPGCWTTGLVPRRSFEKSGRRPTLAYRLGDALLPDDLDEDQAFVMNVRDKGLVVLSGCAHSGIVNTVRHAQEMSGVERIWAILGGFHLATASDQEIQRTIDELRPLNPRMIVPSHCTGFAAIHQFALQMPDAFVLGLVGTTYLF